MMSVQVAPASKIDNAINSICTDKPPDGQNSKITKAALLTLGFAISASAKYFFYPVAKAGATSIFGNNQVGEGFGYVFEVFYSKAFVVLELSALNGIIDGVLASSTQEEKEARQKISNCSRALLVSSVIAAAVFARYPFALPTAEYNSSVPYLAIGFSLIAGKSIPIRSIQLTLSSLSGFYRCHSCCKVESIKRKMVEFIDQCESALLAKTISDLSNKQRGIQAKDPSANSSEYLNEYFASEESFSNKMDAGLKIASAVSSIIFTSILEYAIARYTFDITKKSIVDSSFLAAPLASLAVLTTFYFYGKSIYESNHRFLRFMTIKCNNHPISSLADKIYPKTMTCLKIEGIVSNFLALGPWYGVWGNYFKQPEDVHWFFVSSLLFTLYVTLQASFHNVIEKSAISLVKDEDQKLAIKLLANLQRIKKVITSSEKTDFIIFISGLSPEQKRRFLTEQEVVELEEMRSLVV